MSEITTFDVPLAPIGSKAVWLEDYQKLERELAECKSRLDARTFDCLDCPDIIGWKADDAELKARLDSAMRFVEAARKAHKQAMTCDGCYYDLTEECLESEFCILDKSFEIAIGKLDEEMKR